MRSNQWKYPFGLRWQKDVDVDIDVQAFICNDGHTACTVRSVASVVSIVQTEVNPLATGSAGDVNQKNFVFLLYHKVECFF